MPSLLFTPQYKPCIITWCECGGKVFFLQLVRFFIWYTSRDKVQAILPPSFKECKQLQSTFRNWGKEIGVIFFIRKFWIPKSTISNISFERNYPEMVWIRIVISVAQIHPSNFTLKMLSTVALNNTFVSLSEQRTLDMWTWLHISFSNWSLVSFESLASLEGERQNSSHV